MHVVLGKFFHQAFPSDPLYEGAVRLDVEALPLKPENTETYMWEHEEPNTYDLLVTECDCLDHGSSMTRRKASS